ncbi:hypothetical protein ABZV91_17070 [Nocardia sp. NPDC004568]|uniref:hypothetical protein n=1 Tax=Nocardia sp. NPDC004568 TaxID=3154551 RepID=UPI0033A863CF
MSALGPWTGVVDDVLLRMTNATGQIARRHADYQRGVSAVLGRAAGLERDDANLATEILQESRPQPGARGVVLPSGRFPAYTPSAAEAHVASRRLVVDHELTNALRSGVNGTFVTRDTDGVLYIYKPFIDENYLDFNWLPHVPGQLGIREVAGYRVFELMGSHRMPPTALVNGPYGRGAAQLYVPMKASKDWFRYPKKQQAEAAMGHFLASNADGHPGNYRPRYNGTTSQHPADDLIVYDLGFTFPESPDHLRGSRPADFKSDFVRNWAGQEFPSTVLEPTQAITREQFGSALEDLQLSDNAIDHALRRLDYVKANDTIYKA